MSYKCPKCGSETRVTNEHNDPDKHIKRVACTRCRWSVVKGYGLNGSSRDPNWATNRLGYKTQAEFEQQKQ